MSRLTRDGTAEPVSRDQILRRERGQGNIYFPCSDGHEQDCQPYPVDLYSCLALCDDYIYIQYIHTYIHTYLLGMVEARSVNLRNTTTITYIRTYINIVHACTVAMWVLYTKTRTQTVVSRSLVLAIMLYIWDFGLECKFSKGNWRINGWLLIYFQVQYQ